MEALHEPTLSHQRERTAVVLAQSHRVESAGGNAGGPGQPLGFLVREVGGVVRGKAAAAGEGRAGGGEDAAQIDRAAMGRRRQPGIERFTGQW
ncbi:hypothetical protein GCM10027091_18340 [Streptomyces daliensis]